ncbi:MAG: hypothetical protein KDA80_01095 [Planctomycetaceae bacterium]|nr:hypothetical protein [Planctomycetaceae bacterium]
MSLPQTLADVIDQHVTFETESIDRMDWNVDQPMLQSAGGVSTFFRGHRERRLRHNSDCRSQHLRKAFARKSVKQHLARSPHTEGVVMIIKGQEKAGVYRTIKKTSSETGKSYPWLIKTNAMVNHYDSPGKQSATSHVLATKSPERHQTDLPKNSPMKLDSTAKTSKNKVT